VPPGRAGLRELQGVDRGRLIRGGHAHHLRWGSWLAVGLLSLLAGLVTWLWPGLTALALLYVVVAWALVTSLLTIGAAIEFHDAIPHAWLLALSGVLALALGVVLALDPRSGILSLVLVIGLYAIIAGLSELVFAVRVRRLRRDVDEAAAHLTRSA
jgi:uncharacterized membrane protein HdeD (DUF308 family)